MRFSEYQECAKKHFINCVTVLHQYEPDKVGVISKRDRYIYLEAFYLLGYFFEGMTVYSAYKLYGWPEEKDVEFYYDKDFTEITGIDYFIDRKDKDGLLIFPDRNKNSLSVVKHHFQPIVKECLKIRPEFKNIPYFGDGDIDPEIEQLIDKWDPKIRYYYKMSEKKLPELTPEKLGKLLDVCHEILVNPNI